MDEIETRLRETSETCFNCYEAWQKDKKKLPEREALIEAIHELRKVASRLEIELAVSERNEAVKNPIPVPPHRDAQRRNKDDDRGNRADKGGNNSHGNNDQKPQRKRRPQQKKSD